MKTITIKNPKAIEIIKKLIDDKRYVREKITQNNMDEIKTERPDIWERFRHPI